MSRLSAQQLFLIQGKRQWKGMSSARGNGTLYYKLKFKTGKSEWHFPCKILNVLVRQFHADRTMSGKKRKRPLKKNQDNFFEKKGHQWRERNINSKCVNQL